MCNVHCRYATAHTFIDPLHALMLTDRLVCNVPSLPLSSAPLASQSPGPGELCDRPPTQKRERQLTCQ